MKKTEPIITSTRIYGFCFFVGGVTPYVLQYIPSKLMKWSILFGYSYLQVNLNKISIEINFRLVTG